MILVAPPLCAFVTVAVVTSGRGLVLRHGHSQSVGKLCMRQQEQHALHAPRLRERRVRADERKQRRSQSKPLVSSRQPAGRFLSSSWACWLTVSMATSSMGWMNHIFVFSSFPSFPRVCYFVWDAAGLKTDTSLSFHLFLSLIPQLVSVRSHTWTTFVHVRLNNMKLGHFRTFVCPENRHEYAAGAVWRNKSLFFCFPQSLSEANPPLTYSTVPLLTYQIFKSIISAVSSQTSSCVPGTSSWPFVSWEGNIRGWGGGVMVAAEEN